MKKIIIALILTIFSGAGAFSQSVVINKFLNATPDVVELLVIQDGLDMRGMILKDFSANGVNDGGGNYTFSTNSLWQSVRSGTLIVLRNNNTAADVTVGGGDYLLDVGLQNTTYFDAGAGTFDIATNEIVMIKSAGSGATGNTGAIHSFASGSAGSAANFTGAPGQKLSTTGTTGANTFAIATNATTSLADFNGTGAQATASATLGSGNNVNNTSYINSLRGPDVTPPIISSLNPLNGATNVALDANLIATFNEPIQKGTGDIIIRDVLTNDIFETIDVTTTRVTVVGSSATIDPVGTLNANTQYQVEIPAGAFRDLAATPNDFAGISGNDWRFTTIDPFNYTENFNAFAVGGVANGWTRVSVTGAQVWGGTTFGRSGNGVQMNGFLSGPQDNEDWLISPAFNLTAFNFPIFQFWSRVAFTGPGLNLRVSTNYNGGGTAADVAAATWTDIPSVGFATADAWTQSNQLDLSAFKQPTVYIAFRYTSSTVANAARWTLDDVSLRNSATPPPAPSPTISTSITPLTDLDFGIVTSGSSAAKIVTVTGSGLTNNLVITAPPNFEVARGLDGTGRVYSNQVTYTASEANLSDSLYVRFTAPATNGTFAGQLNLVSTGATTLNVGWLTGATIDVNRTFDIVTLNLEWFGSTTQGPTNETLQLNNAAALLVNLNADVYNLIEISNTTAFTNLIAEMNTRTAPGTFAGVISNFTSQTFNDPAAQRPAFIYRTATVSPVSHRALMTTTQTPPTGTTFVNPNVTSANYPGGDPTRFWASGRLPFLLVADVTIAGTTRRLHLVNVHARANGSESSSSPRYAMRRFDVEALKDTLDTHFPTANIIMSGDYNDDVDFTVATSPFSTPQYPNPGTTTSYISYNNDPLNYRTVSRSLSDAGLRTFITFENVIDHIMISNELYNDYLPASERVVIPNSTLIPGLPGVTGASGYEGTTSDHLPVLARFQFPSTGLAVAGGQSNFTITPAAGATINFSTTGTTSGTLSGARFGSAPTGNNTIDQPNATAPDGSSTVVNRISQERWWTITQSGLTGFNYNISLDISGLSGVTNPDRLVILKRDAAGWVAQNTTRSGNTLTTTAGLNSFSDFTIGSSIVDNPLPVELSEFRAQRVERGVELVWTTASEKNNAGFEVQARTDKGQASREHEWRVLGFVKGNGTTSDAKSYSFMDRTATGKVQYRLKQIDFDGTFEMLPTVEVDAGLPRTFELAQNYPNPFNPTTAISYQLPVASEVSLKVYDLLGREVATLVNARQDAGRYSVLFKGAALASGMYFYRLQAGSFVETKKMMLVK
jgi:hypothetical protein